VDTEFDDFKRLDLRVYAASIGFELVRRESSRASSVMARGTGANREKIVIKQNPNGHFVWFAVRDDFSNGTIIDFVQHYKGGSYGVVRKELRPWVGRPSSPIPLFAPLQPSVKDREGVEHPYLENVRRLSPALLSAPRFLGRIRIDARGNAVFPHFDAHGLCGFEIKNETFTGFSPGGSKGLWESHDFETDDGLVLTESAIDALSYADLHPLVKARYRSIGGAFNHEQPGLIRQAVLDLPPRSTVICAMDNDASGWKLVAMAQKAVDDANRPDIACRTDVPPTEGQDWNDVRKSHQSHLPIAPSPGSP
jgi:hypothetical protein